MKRNGQTRMMTIGQVAGMRIALVSDPEVEHGHQWICIADDGEVHGLWLASLLQGANDQTLDVRDGWYWVRHTAETDARLRALVDVCAAIRRCAPQLVQLTLAGVGDDD